MSSKRKHVLWVVRHGETESNKKNIIQGQNQVPLSQHGHNQAKLVGKWLSKFDFDAAMCSDLRRAVETMEHILEYHEELVVEYDQSVREKHCGIYEGKPRGYIEKLAMSEGYGGRLREYRPEGGESNVDVFNRAKAVVEKIEERFLTAEGKPMSLLLVSHGRFMYEMFTHLNGGKSLKHAPQNTAVYRFGFKEEDRTWTVELQNQTDHLHRAGL